MNGHCMISKHSTPAPNANVEQNKLESGSGVWLQFENQFWIIWTIDMGQEKYIETTVVCKILDYHHIAPRLGWKLCVLSSQTKAKRNTKSRRGRGDIDVDVDGQNGLGWVCVLFFVYHAFVGS